MIRYDGGFRYSCKEYGRLLEELYISFELQPNSTLYSYAMRIQRLDTIVTLDLLDIRPWSEITIRIRFIFCRIDFFNIRLGSLQRDGLLFV